MADSRIEHEIHNMSPEPFVVPESKEVLKNKTKQNNPNINGEEGMAKGTGAN